MTPGLALFYGGLDRAKFGGWLLFAFGWFTLVYVPVAKWIWGGGFIFAKLHALDFAGGTAVHINAGSAALALALVLGRRVGWPKESFRPHNVPLVALGAGLLWFGWFGFNAGSELTADAVTAVAFVNTQVATAAALLGWIIVEWIRGRPTMVGASSGAVVGVHFVGGWIGSLWIGLFATSNVTSLITDGGPSNGLFTGGGLTQLGRQALCSGIVSVYSFSMAIMIGWVIQKTIGFRATTEAEVDSIDVAEHAESGYDLSPAGGGAGAFALAGVGTPTSTPTPDKAPDAAKVAG